MTILNATGQFGISPYVVGPGAYTTIASAMAAAAAATPKGTVYVSPGTYVESDTWPAGISVIGVSAGSTTAGVTNYSVKVQGQQTFSSAGTLSISNIEFDNTTGNAWTVSNAAANVSFGQCLLNATGAGGQNSLNVTAGNVTANATDFNSSAGSAVNYAGGNGSFTSCTMSATGAGINTVSLGASATIAATSNIITSSSGNDILVGSATSTWNGNYNQYTAALSGILFTAAGTARSIDEIYNSSSPSGFFINSTVPGQGTVTSALATVNGTASSIGPNVNSNTYPVASAPGAFTWLAISASQAISSNNGYIITGGSVTITLPATASVGSVFAVILDGGTYWTIAQNGGQQLRVGSRLSTLGAGGSLGSNNPGDAVYFVCSVANTRWVAYTTVGNLTIV